MGDSTKKTLLMLNNVDSLKTSSSSSMATSMKKVCGQQVTGLEDDYKMAEKTTQKTTTHIKRVSADQVAPEVAKTIEGSPTRQFSNRKSQNVTTAKASGQLTKFLLTKPQQVYTSVEIGDQTIPGCTGPFHQWERSVEKWRETLRPIRCRN